jgi:hypothetical protein
MKKAFIDRSQAAAWAGIIGPALFVAVFTIEGWLRPGYNSLSTYVSALSLGPRGWIQIVNFIVFGMLLFLFSRGVAAEFPSGKASRAGASLLFIIAFLYFISGPFVMDPMGTPSLEGSLHGTIHGLAGGIVFILMPICIFVFLRRFREDPRWQPLQGPTVILGIITALAVVLFSIVSKSPTLVTIFKDWLGLFQRSLIIPFMIWVFLFGLRLFQYRRNRAKE